MTVSTRTPVKPTEPWRQRLIRSLLYGRNVDRAAKARARVGLVMLAFAAVYAVIGGRLIMFAIVGDSHGARRAAAHPARRRGRRHIHRQRGRGKGWAQIARSVFPH